MIDKETSCGAFDWRPKWLQKCASKKVYIVIYGLLGVVQGMSISYFRAVLSTLEKQFGIKSKQSAYLMSGKIISLIRYVPTYAAEFTNNEAVNSKCFIQAIH